MDPVGLIGGRWKAGQDTQVGDLVAVEDGGELGEYFRESIAVPGWNLKHKLINNK